MFNILNYINKIILLHGDKYDYSLINYINTITPIKIICNIHGEFFQKPAVHLRGHGCPKCGFIKNKETIRLTTKKFIKKAEIIHNHKYIYDKTIFTNSKSKLIITCPTHGDFIQNANGHLNGKGCKICRESRGENKIRLFLEKKNILHYYQHHFKNCIGNSKRKTPLFFDFYLPDQNLCIEYDGIHHFKPIMNFGYIDGFKKCIENDNIKNEYCKQEGIKLIRIKYDQYDEIEKILIGLL